MERIRRQDISIGWSPARGSYEEAVLSWHEQIDQSFRRQSESQRTTLDSRIAIARERQSLAIGD